MVRPSTPDGVMPLEFGEPPEAWLIRYDRKPRIIPSWPRSDKMVLVAVTKDGDSTSASLVLTQEAMDRLARPGGKPSLFFSVPRSTLENRLQIEL